MLNALAVLLNEAGDGALRGGTLQQLQLTVAAGQERNSHLLLLDNFRALAVQAQRLLIPLHRSRQILDRDTDMINSCAIHNRDLLH